MAGPITKALSSGWPGVERQTLEQVRQELKRARRKGNRQCANGGPIPPGEMGVMWRRSWEVANLTMAKLGDLPPLLRLDDPDEWARRAAKAMVEAEAELRAKDAEAAQHRSGDG